ncbi:TPA: hypothetical protein HA324_03930 [Candidatus Thalassarchaeaceae archaeon]|jgi:hypothetical protein|nr:hypothetical protein [Euryarchaeota archaeon]MDG1547686.1 hypothetical protein [Candidatus Thalassarchaeaceae archaeon]DAC61984.1 MAG TPA: hypothetical protein D7I02_04620 [Candidatus Poseidoniales archaeon]MBT3846690.1 hypothetical protein [Euryarchaeota archaeon]MBT4156352.1 hypothetical protein [Euryarchaeota archaeon]
MDGTSDDGEGSPRIDVRALPESVARLWETMLRLDPSWDISTWLDERASEELQMVEGQLGREKLRLEQRLHRLETLAKRLKRQREIAEGVVWTDPHQKNLFDIYEPEEKNKTSSNLEEEEDFPAVDYTNLEIGDDPLLAIVAEHIMHILESLAVKGEVSMHFNLLLQELGAIGIREEEVDEAITWLLQREMIIELEQDYFSLDI